MNGFFALLIISLVILAIGLYSLIKYRDFSKEVDKEVFQLYKILGIGKFILDNILRDSASYLFSNRVSNLKNNYAKLYEKSKAEKYTKHHLYQSFTYWYLAILVTFIVATYFSYGVYFNEGVVYKEITKIEKPQFGDEGQSKKMLIKIGEGEDAYSREVKLYIDTRNATKAQAEKIFEQLDKYYDDYFASITVDGVINSDIDLKTEYENYDFKTTWKIDNNDYLTDNGHIKSYNIPLEGVNVNLTAITKVAEHSHQYTKTIFVKRVLDKKEAADVVLKEAKEALGKGEIANVELKTSLANDAEQIKWYEVIGEEVSEKGVILVIMLGLAVAFLVNYSMDDKVKTSIKKRNEEIKMEFPIFADKFILYIHCGMSPDRALAKYLQATDKKTALREEVQLTLKEIEYYGIDVREAFLSFGKRTRIQEVIKFSSLVAQMIKKGDDDIREALNQLIKDSWEEKRKLVLQKGSKASTKLLLPMLLLMILVVLIAITPALSTMTGF